VIGETITLKEVLAWMDGGMPFDFAVVTCDLQKNTGGEWLEVKNARKQKMLTTSQQKQLSKSQPKSSVIRNPNHFDNSTRNLILQNGEFMKVHIRLMRRFNNKTIM
jgi:hypothetical protein